MYDNKKDLKDGLLAFGVIYIVIPAAFVLIGFIAKFFIDLANPPKVPNPEVRVNSSIVIEEGYDVALSDDDSGFMYISGIVRNNGKKIEATDLRLVFDVFDGEELVGQCFMVNPNDIEEGGFWRMKWDVLYSNCVTDAGGGKDTSVESTKYSDYTLGNKPYYDDLYKYLRGDY